MSIRGFVEFRFASRCCSRRPRSCRCSPTASSPSCRSSAARGRRSIQGNQNVAIRAAEEIRRYVVTNADLLKVLSADLQDTGLTQAQQDRILKNYVLLVREFREITLFDESGNTIATSRIGKPRVADSDQRRS